MAPARKHRRLPTLIDRGRGLLEVVLPYGPGDDVLSMLPDGQRDAGGFWFPHGYARPDDIFTPEQRKLQAKQRQVQRQRIGARDRRPPAAPGPGVSVARETSPSRPHAPPSPRQASSTGPGGACLERSLADTSLPLPAPFSEAPGAMASAMSVACGACPPPPARAARAVPDAPPGIRAGVSRPVVDSQKGSD